MAGSAGEPSASMDMLPSKPPSSSDLVRRYNCFKKRNIAAYAWFSVIVFVHTFPLLNSSSG